MGTLILAGILLMIAIVSYVAMRRMTSLVLPAPRIRRRRSGPSWSASSCWGASQWSR